MEQMQRFIKYSFYDFDFSWFLALSESSECEKINCMNVQWAYFNCQMKQMYEHLQVCVAELAVQIDY